jgi:hypothetical protein
MSSEAVFGPGPDFSLNACVGDNTGSDDDYNYVLGFAQAALALVAVAKQQFYRQPGSRKKVSVYQDALIYPICFNARHHIELFLKRQIQRVAWLRKVNFDKELLADHDIGNLLEELTRLCTLVDRRLPVFLQPLSSAIEAFADIDPTGQTFRYRESLEGKLHLDKLGHINLAPLEQTFRMLFRGTEKFEQLVEFLEYEYDQVAHTSKLSRYELSQLATALPERSSWATNPEFVTVKNDFMARFGLSSNDFCRAVKAIEKHYQFAGRIGLEVPLPHVDPERLRKLVALELDIEQLDAAPQAEWEALSVISEVGYPDAYPEQFAHRMKRLDDEERVGVSAHDVVRGITMASARFRRGLDKLGQKALLATFDEALATRKRAATGRDEEANAVQEFNARVRRHLFGHHQAQGKYASDSTEPSDDGAGSQHTD